MPTDQRAVLLAAKTLEHLQAGGVALESGLTEAEIQEVEARLGCALPPDLRTLLGAALPSGPGFPQWRGLDSSVLGEQLAHPVEGIIFDVEHNGFWHPDWPERPVKLRDAIAVARSELAMAPVLIPIYRHRFLPSQPSDAGNPVLSVMQTDIICYGQDLAEYVSNDHVPHRWQLTEPLRKPPFWTYFLDTD